MNLFEHLFATTRPERVRAGGPMVFAIFVLFLIATLAGLGGCAGGLYREDVNIDTTRKALAIADAEIRGQVLLVTDLLRRKVITAQTAARAHDNLQQAKNALQRGLNAVNVAGDPLVAESELAQADAALGLALELVAPYVTPSAN